MQIWECRSGRLERKGAVQKENTEYTKKECIYFEVGATGLNIISEIRGFILCTTQVHLKICGFYTKILSLKHYYCVLSFFVQRGIWVTQITHSSFAKAYKLQYYEIVPGVQTEFLQYGIPIYIFNIILKYNQVSGLFLENFM